MFLKENIHYIVEENIEVDYLKGKYNILCFDGIAFAKEIGSSKTFEIIYPKMEEVDYDQRTRVQGYRGLKQTDKINYNDVMFILGRVKLQLN